MQRPLNQIPVFFILTLLVVGLFGIRTIGNPTIWKHIATGQALATKNVALANSQDPFCFTTSGEKWMSTSPLYDRLMYSMADAPALIALTHVFAALIAFILLALVAKKWSNSLSSALALFICGIMIAPVFTPAPLFFGMLFLTIFVFCTHNAMKPPIRWAILIITQILWVNMHASFILGPIICGLASIQAAQTSKGKKRNSSGAMKEFILLAVATLLVTFLNPVGLKLHIYLLQYGGVLINSHAGVYISPFQHLFSKPMARQMVTLALVLGAGGLITLKKQLPLVLTTLAISSAFFMVRSLNFTTLFVFLAFPFLALSFQAVGESIQHAIEPMVGKNKHLPDYVVKGILSLFLICAAWDTISNQAYARTGSVSRFGLGQEQSIIPVMADNIISHPSFPDKVLNLAFDGAYLSYKYPNKKFYCDLREELFDHDFNTNYLAALTTDKEGWKTLQSTHVPLAAILNCFTDESRSVLRTFLSRGWQLAHFDGSYAIVLSPSKRNTELLTKAKAAKSGLSSLEAELTKYRTHKTSGFAMPNSAQLIGAGNAFLALNRFAEAESVYSTLLRVNPSMRSAWLSYGQSLIAQKKTEKGIESLEISTKAMPNNGYAWLTLQKAYQATGQKEKAAALDAKLSRFFKPAE
jgi:tetratricopeptide (TPR) repeat protein